MHQCALNATNEKWLSLAKSIARDLYYTHRLSLSWDETLAWAFLGLVEGLSLITESSSDGQRYSYLKIKIGGAILDAARRYVRIGGRSVGFSNPFVEWCNAMQAEAAWLFPSTPEEVLQNGEERHQLRAALRVLPRAEVELLSAVYDAHRIGDNATQLAKRRGVHLTTIYRQRTRIIKRLRKEIGGLHG